MIDLSRFTLSDAVLEANHEGDDPLADMRAAVDDATAHTLREVVKLLRERASTMWVNADEATALEYVSDELATLVQKEGKQV